MLLNFYISNFDKNDVMVGLFGLDTRRLYEMSKLMDDAIKRIDRVGKLLIVDWFEEIYS
mgnify:FL=1